MSHVADGDLHAYLDGALDRHSPGEADRIRAHLEACPECRRRLGEEERIRDRAHEILTRTDPGLVEPPPFEEVRRRGAAEAGRPSGSRRRPIAFGLSWAASVILAVGAGWMAGHESTDPVRSARPSPAMAPARGAGSTGSTGEARVADADAASSLPPSVEIPAPPPASPGRAPAAGGRVAVAPPREPAAAQEETKPRSAEDVAAAPERFAAARRERALADSVSAKEPGTIVGRIVRTGTDSPLVGAQVTVQGTGLGVLTDDRGRYVLTGVPPGERTLQAALVGYGTVTDTVTVRPGDTSVVDLAPSVATVALDALVVTADSISGGVRRVLGSRVDSLRVARARTPAAADRDRGGDAPVPAAESAMEEAAGPAVRELAIPGLAVLQVAWTEVAPGVEGLLVVQRLAGDTTRLELRVGGLEPDTGDRRNERSAAGGAPPRELLDQRLPEGVSQAWSPLPGGGWMVLRGRLARERLERLLDLIR